MSRQTWRGPGWDLTCARADRFPYGPGGYLLAPEQWTILLADVLGAQHAQALLRFRRAELTPVRYDASCPGGLGYRVGAVEVTPGEAGKILSGVPPLDVLLPAMTVTVLRPGRADGAVTVLAQRDGWTLTLPRLPWYSADRPRLDGLAVTEAQWIMITMNGRMHRGQVYRGGQVYRASPLCLILYDIALTADEAAAIKGGAAPLDVLLPGMTVRVLGPEELVTR